MNQTAVAKPQGLGNTREGCWSIGMLRVGEAGESFTRPPVEKALAERYEPANVENYRERRGGREATGAFRGGAPHTAERRKSTELTAAPWEENAQAVMDGGRAKAVRET